MQTISKDTPLSEITLRKYEKPSKLSERELVRKICLSLGLLQPGDSRDIIVDILQVLINASKSKQMLSSEQIEKQVIEARKNNSTPLTGTASSNIRRQLKRLRDIFLIEKIKNEYRLTEFSDIRTIFEEKILKYYLSSISERIYEYSDMLDGRSSNTHTDS